MPTIHTGDVDLYYEAAGQGPPLLLLHGLGSSTRDWQFQVPDLARSFRVITLDVRGHGRSSKPPGPYSVKQFAADSVAVLRALDAMPAHIIGLSMGGMIAFQMAVDTPDAVRSLVIVNSGPAMILRSLSQRALIRVRFAVIRLFGMRALGRMVARPLFPDPGQEALRQSFEDHLAENDPHAYRAALRALIGWTVEDHISQIRCPALVIGSEGDYTSIDWKREYAARIPDARVEILKNSRHAAPLDQPEQLNRMILEFLASAEARSRQG